MFDVVGKLPRLFRISPICPEMGTTLQSYYFPLYFVNVASIKVWFSGVSFQLCAKKICIAPSSYKNRDRREFGAFCAFQVSNPLPLFDMTTLLIVDPPSEFLLSFET